jgi:phosphatidylinositol-bisphosphatase
MPAISLVSDLLRSPDEVKVVLEATLVTTSDANQDLQNRRVLAVVSHKEDWDLTEEGRYICYLFTFNLTNSTKKSLFVCKYKNHINGQPEELDIQQVFPIYGEFSVVISQMHRGTVALRPTMSSKSVLEQPRAGKKGQVA